MDTSDTDFAAASQRRSLLFVALSPEDSGAAAEGLKAKSRRWRLTFSPTTTEALKLLRATPFDTVVMDLQARAIDPNRFFKEVMESCPEALRIGLTRSDERTAILQANAPVHQFLSRPLDPMVLTAVLARAFAAQDFLHQEHFRKLVHSIDFLPVVPDAYTALLGGLNAEKPSPERVAELLGTDLALCAKILQLVNSAFFGLGRPIRHAADAVAILGTETIKALVLALNVFSQFSRVRLREFSPESLWQHSWTTGVLARRLCEFEEAERSIADEAFMGGLLHDMGKLVLAANYPSLTESNIAEASLKKIGVWEQEFLVHGASHAELGGYLLRRWGLQPGVVDAVTFHHRPMLARMRTFSALTAVHAANTLQRTVAGGDGASHTMDVGYLRTLGMEARQEDWQNCVAELLERSGEAMASP